VDKMLDNDLYMLTLLRQVAWKKNHVTYLLLLDRNFH